MIKGNKVVCAVCANEENRKCTVKKATVALNKRRRCDLLKTVRMGPKEKEALRREYKEQLKEFKAAARQGTEPRNMKNPLTGDLSRFVSTAGKERGAG